MLNCSRIVKLRGHGTVPFCWDTAGVGEQVNSKATSKRERDVIDIGIRIRVSCREMSEHKNMGKKKKKKKMIQVQLLRAL